jgi:glucose-6-phosphate dehydrogenase assembly protein OpcA
MSDPITSLTNGMPVEIGKIDRELKQLWKQGEGAATRASLINFAIYCEGENAIAETTELISEFTREHACRAILIATEPNAPEKRVQAWISAHCHISRAGAKQVCCEQITFLLEGQARDLIPNIVFSHLDSDLPLYLWWRGEFPEQPDEQLWKWVDRLIFDSQAWKNPRHQFELLENSIAAAKPRLTLCDLNWTRSLYLRQAISQIFDHPENLQELPNVTRITIRYAPHAHTTAMLLTGWMVAQLQLHVRRTEPDKFHLADSGERPAIDLDLQQSAGEDISEVSFESPGAAFRVFHKEDSGYLNVEVRLPDGREFHHLRPSGEDNLVALLDTELSRGSKHEVYLKVLSATEPLL